MVILDADFLLYKIGYSTDDIETAKDELHRYLDKLMYKFKVKTLSLILSGPSEEGFRRDLIDPTYKTHRPNNRPEIYDELRKYMVDELDAYEVYGLEADDVISIMVTTDYKDTIVVSNDKDFYTVPCNFYRLGVNEGDIMQISKSEADYNHAIQTLTGTQRMGIKELQGLVLSRRLSY